MKNKRNLRLLFAIAFLQGMVFYAPIASLYRQAAGLTLAQISLIEGISYILTLAMELPWGMLADRIGYRRTMAVSCALYFLSKLVFWQAAGFAAFLAERFLLSIALAGLSGVEESMLYLSCEPSESQRVFGRREACATAGMVFASAVYMLFIGSHYRLAALLTMVSYAAAALLCFGLREVRAPGKSSLPAIGSFVSLLKQILRSRALLLFIAGFAIFQEAVQMVTVWLNQNQYLRCGMNEHGIGAAYLLVSAATLFSAQSGRLTGILGAKRFSTAVLLAGGAACVLLIFTRSAYLSVLLIAVVAAARALLAPLAAALLNRGITTANRATALSVYALLQNFVSAGAQAVYGRAADYSLNAAFALCALAAAGAWLAFRVYHPAAAE